MDINTIMQAVGNHSLVLIPIVLGITQILKQFIPVAFLEKGTPPVSLLTGVLSSMALNGLNRQSIIVGIIIGLSAAGLWSTAISPFKSKTPPTE